MYICVSNDAVRRGVARQADHVGEVVELAVEVAHDGHLLASGVIILLVIVIVIVIVIVVSYN